MSSLSLSLEVTRVIAVSETSAAQVGSPLVPHVFLHQTVEHKNKEAWDGKEETREDKFDFNLLLGKHVLSPFTQKNLTLQTVEDGEQVD